VFHVFNLEGHHFELDRGVSSQGGEEAHCG
jgi:hypothetical protein